jgi:cell division protease FtsH
MVLPDTDKYSTSRSELLDKLAYMMGGRAAEEMVFHDPTTGAGNDIDKATSLARAMVTQYGMTERLGAIKFGQDSGEPFLGRDLGSQRNYSEEIAAAVDEEVGKLILNAHQEAFDILVENRAVLDHLVEELLEKETLDKAEVARVFGPVVRRAPRPAWTGSSTRVPSEQPPVMPVPNRGQQNGSLSDVIPGGTVGPDEAVLPPSSYGSGATPPAE